MIAVRRGFLTLSSGYTLIEILATLTIVFLLAAIAVPFSQVSMQRSKEVELRRALLEIRTAINVYKAASDDGKILKKMGDSGYPPNLDVLVSGVTNAKSPSGQPLYFLRRIPRDPFSERSVSGGKSWGLRSYNSPPEEPTEGVDVFDVFSRSAGRSLDGTLYREW